MDHKNIDILKTFTLGSIPDLDTAVVGALELFQNVSLPQINIPYRRPLVVGSGNAEATGRIMFEDADAIFASESTYEGKLAHIPDIDGVILLSASGGKHAPIIARRAKELDKPVTLITNNSDAPARKFVEPERVFVFPKNREPYTYNTSTYLGMILGKTHEDPGQILSYLRTHIDTLALPDFATYNKYFVIVPARLSGIIRMLQVKFIELFGRRIARDVETDEYMKHAVTVVPSDELFLSFGFDNTLWGSPERRFTVPLPPDAGYGMMLAVGYYVVGKIQKANPPYFKEHIAAYTEKASAAFGQMISPIVE